MYTKIGRLIFGLVTLMLCVSLSVALAGEEKGKDQGVQKVLTNDNYNWFTINNLFNWYGNNGNSSLNQATGQSGLEFPKGSAMQPVYEDGVMWGGFHKGRIAPKIGGSAYKYGLQAGEVTGYGGALETQRPPFTDPLLAKYRVYKVRPDVTPATKLADVQATMQAEADLINRFSTMTAQTLFNKYVQDWNEWPAKDGLPAPYKDVDGNGSYDPTKDIPGQVGADQTLYYVANDLNATRTTALYFSPPIGVEVHTTVWGYNLPGALGNTIFASTLIINKSGAPLDSTFLMMWSDPDLGEAGDDYAGCDVARSLGYVYNGKNVDLTYGSAVPAVGYDFFQGPIVATGNNADSAVFRLKYRKGFKNLGMSTFDFFINGSSTYTDPGPQGGAGSDVQVYNLMNATIAPSAQPFINPITKLPTKFCLDGDPLTGKGWLDGTYGLVPGDRRICLVTGPFTLANKDTQELVVATIVGLGGDRISSIAVLKYYSDLAQSAYNTLFNISRPPPSPAITVAALDGEVLISWPDSIGPTKIEKWSSGGYAFEGYNVYQFPTSEPAKNTATRLATYDILNSVTTIFDDLYDEQTGYVVSKPAQFGTDIGIKRSYLTSTDAIGKRSLINGSTYYFGVSSYSFNGSPTAKPTQLESTPAWYAVVPQSPNPGTTYNTTPGATVVVTHNTGISTAQSYATVIDPTKVQGKEYEVRITVTDSVLNPDLGFNVANPKWAVYNVATNKPLMAPSTDFNFSNSNPIIEAVQFGLSGAPFYVAGKELGSLTWTPAANFNFSKVNDTPYPGDSFINSILTPDQVAQDVQMEFTATGQGQKAYDFVRTATSGSGGSKYEGYYDQPFKAYELNPDGTRKRQIDFLFMEDKTRTTYNQVWAPGTATSDREYWYFVTETYSATAKAKYVAGTTTLNNALLADSCVWSGWYTKTSASKPAYNVGDVWTIKTTKVVTAADKWRYSTIGLAPVVGDVAKAAADADRVNVYPNPYIGFNPQEADKYTRFVTFTHLPYSAVIRIFNLAGVLVRTLKKDEASQFFQWDLRNESGFPAAAGMYIVYIDMPDIGKVKTLKLGIIPEQQFIDKW